MAIIACTQPYARRPEGGGLASAFLQERPAKGVLVAAVVAPMGLAVLWKPLAGPVALAAAALAALSVAALGRRQLGGFTGDVLGAAGVMAETVGLVVAAARW